MVDLATLAPGAGVASFFAPCAFPLLVTLLARDATETLSASGRHAPPIDAARSAAALAIGAAVFLLLCGAVIGMGSSTAVSRVTFTSDTGRALRLVTGTTLVGLGLVQL